MSRPLRIDIVDGWYHVMSRGTERRDVFADDLDRSYSTGLPEACVASTVCPWNACLWLMRDSGGDWRKWNQFDG